MNTSRRARINSALHAFMRLPADDQRVLLEVLRRVVGGDPLEHALEAVTDSTEVPQHWKA